MEDDMFPRTEDDTPVTALERRTVLQRRVKTWIKIWLICAFLACSPLLYAYANFRAVRGEVFFRAINTEPGLLYARIPNTWGMEISEVLAPRMYNTPADIFGHYVYWWGAHSGDAVLPFSSDSERLVATVTCGKSTLRIFIGNYPQQSEEDFNRDYPGLVDEIVRRFTDQGVISWKESTTAQLRWLPSLVGYYVGFPSLNASPNTLATLQMYVESVVMLPGFVPLFLLILSPSWLALPIFWLYAVLSVLIILYVVLPQRAWGWMKTRAKLLWTSMRHHQEGSHDGK
jgi:hypothetical protein